MLSLLVASGKVMINESQSSGASSVLQFVRKVIAVCEL